MELLKTLIPPELKQRISASTPETLPSTCTSLLDFLRQHPQFQLLIADLLDPAAALFRKSRAAALDWKAEGNAAFAKEQFAEAVMFYSKALRHAPMKHGEEEEVKLVVTLFVNRASAMHKIDLFEECLRDCNRAIALSPVYAKAWYRRGKVNASMKNYRAAVCDLEVSSLTEVSSSGRKHIKEEIEILRRDFNSANEPENSFLSGDNKKFTDLAEPDNILLECVSTPSKGRGMASPNDVPPSSLLHCEEPLAAIMTKSCRETHCHFCFNKVQTDVCFCPSCTIPIYCSQYCQELAGGKPFLRNMGVDKMSSEFSADIEKHVRDTIADSYSKYAVTNLNTEHIPEHRHECGGANWSAVLPPHVVLAGRVMMQSIEKRKDSGEFSKPVETLDLAHNYLEIPSEVKLQLHIFASVLSYCLQCHASDFPLTGDSVSKLVILMSQIKINSMAVVHMESSGGYTTFKESQRLSAFHNAFSCTIEQVRVGQAIYSKGSLFNHSCKPNIHAYFLSRRLLIRSTEFVQAWHPLELSYGPQVGQLDLRDRQELLKEQYSFICQCTSCSEANLTDLVINAYRCGQPNCVGAVSETFHYEFTDDDFVLVSGGSFCCELRLPVLKEEKDISKVASMLLRKTSVIRHFPLGHCLGCGKNLDLGCSKVASKSALMDLERLRSSILSVNPGILISDVLESLIQLKRVRHPYSKVLAQAEDNIAEFFVRIREFERAVQHCIASTEILEMLYHPNHIVIGHELMKLASIQLALGDDTAALYNIKRLEAIFALYYGSHAVDLFPYIKDIRREAESLAC